MVSSDIRRQFEYRQTVYVEVENKEKRLGKALLKCSANSSSHIEARVCLFLN